MSAQLSATVDAKSTSQTMLAVAVETICSASVLDFDLYLKTEPNSPAKLYRRSHVPIEPGDIERLKARGVRTLYVASEAAATYQAYLRDNVLSDESIPAAQKFELLQGASRSVYLNALQGGDVNTLLAVTDDLSEQIVSILWNQKQLLFELFGVMTHDYSTYAHAVNVSSYAILLAQELGINDVSKLAEIGRGGLLHDVGKQFIAADVLSKTGPLTGDDQELIKQHPTRGFESLCRRDDISWGQLMMVYQHHERTDGRGYPAALVGNEIHEWGRLCAVADVFDALTRDRPYRRGSPSLDVLEYLDHQAGRGFDEEMVRCWIQVVKRAL